ncbi:hypothetical protein N7527_003254 [Penicillium freii]|nr:hypothetical protein N7527_003254 [Penicillium freii]
MQQPEDIADGVWRQRFGEVVTPPTQIGDDAFQMDFDDRDWQRASSVEQTPNPETNYSDTCPTSNKAAPPEPAAFQATAGESSEEPEPIVESNSETKEPPGQPSDPSDEQALSEGTSILHEQHKLPYYDKIEFNSQGLLVPPPADHRLSDALIFLIIG